MNIVTVSVVPLLSIFLIWVKQGVMSEGGMDMTDRKDRIRESLKEFKVIDFDGKSTIKGKAKSVKGALQNISDELIQRIKASKHRYLIWRLMISFEWLIKLLLGIMKWMGFLLFIGDIFYILTGAAFYAFTHIGFFAGLMELIAYIILLPLTFGVGCLGYLGKINYDLLVFELKPDDIGFIKSI